MILSISVTIALSIFTVIARRHRYFEHSILIALERSRQFVANDSTLMQEGTTAVLRTATFVYHHFRQVSFNNVTIRSEVYQRHRRELDRCAARLHACQVVQLAVLLHDMRVVVEECVRRSVCPSTVALAVVGIVTTRGYDPVFPAELFETDEESLLAALTLECPWAVQCPAANPSGRCRVCVNDKEWSLRIFLFWAEQNCFHQVAAPWTVNQ